MNQEFSGLFGAAWLSEPKIDSDGLNRCCLPSFFASRTGRNQPSNTAYISSPAGWLRYLIRPDADRAGCEHDHA